MRILAIDPGNVESAFVVFDGQTVLEKAKLDNHELERLINGVRLSADERLTHELISRCDDSLIEMVASYGMAVGASVFETCVQIGRFETLLEAADVLPTKVYRKDIKMHHCGQMQAKDSNIKQALIDKYAKDTPNHGKGTKAEPGFFYGFKADIWQAFALAAYWAETGDDA